MWRNNDCPCTRDCPDRWVAVDGSTPRTCHGTCERYEKWVKKREAERAEQRKHENHPGWTYAQKKAYWAAKRRDPYKKSAKKFSQ